MMSVSSMLPQDLGKKLAEAGWPVEEQRVCDRIFGCGSVDELLLAVSSLNRGEAAELLGWAQRSSRSVETPTAVVSSDNSDGDPGNYQEWIAKRQVKRNAAKELQSGVIHSAPEATEKPPPFSHSELFYPGVERYALGMTSLPSANLSRVAKLTEEKALFAPCMVGQLEGQFLKTITLMKGARRILDVGTFTGYSAAAFAEAVPSDGVVVTIENDEETARVAAEIFSGFGEETKGKIDLRVTSALEEMKKLRLAGEKFDIIFIDADKDNYIPYYDEAMEGLLSEEGVIMADNSLCALVYEEGDSRRDALHRFNQHVREDERVEQSVLTVREGITVIVPKRK
uniref:Uncharacterized protein n=1 Tax=Chromera velia CCMP2878 TaxID=1169474 RepID=A0A0G4GH33_9ALVE|eukprot:Cvel_21883.t1-p1 / transcript=Cvel_21883.t1 / gene=Cvel_21883 / organism=Chromera_velia_CCMP2878 / gene_product=O-methyltransferase MdmC, putative / transcript_product=O-methyltransferase MdmC, putative / location=Cvel_scaffold2093:6164-7183(-) / protein_length=340 / sequence_SO=supercontig / SO=protein_coding / is_pseudo=false